MPAVLTDPFQGEVGANIRKARWAEIIYATRGLTFAHATDALVKGLRDSVDFEAKVKTKVDVAGRLMVDYIDISVKGKFYEASLSRLKNMYLLSKDFHQLRLKNQDGEYLSLVDDTGTLAVPTGTSLVGTKLKLVIDKDSRHIETESICRLTLEQAKYLVDHFGTGSTGGTGGTPTPLVPEGYDPSRANYSRAGFYRLYIDGVNIGIWKDAKLEINFEKGIVDDKGRPIPQFGELKGEVTLLQTAADDFLATLNASRRDVPVRFDTMNADSIICNMGAISATPDWTLGDKDMMQKISFQGTIPYNGDEATPTGFDFSVTDELSLNLIGYPLP